MGELAARRRVSVIGIGPGDIRNITLAAIDGLTRASAIFIPRKGDEKAGLAEIRRALCDRYVENPDQRVVEFDMPVREQGGDYRVAVDDWHARIAEEYERLFARHLTEADIGAFLVWGDPGLYDSTLRILERVRRRGAFDLDIEVVPGITSVQALSAKHKIPLNDIGSPVTVAPARRLQDALAAGAESVVVMLGSGRELGAIDPDAEIYWGANLGLPDETLIAGRLGAVADEIAQARAQLRRENGWVMDVYLVRKRPNKAAPG